MDRRANILDMWRVLGRSLTSWWPRRWRDHRAEFGFAARAFGEACYAFWQGGPSGQPGFLPDERMHSRSGEGYARLRQRTGACELSLLTSLQTIQLWSLVEVCLVAVRLLK
jgi:hypothetical protein